MQTSRQKALKDAFKSAAILSKVSPKKKKSLTHFYWLGGGLLAVLFVWWLSIPQTKNISKKTTKLIMRDDYRASLNANLAHLRAMREKKPESISSVNDSANTALFSQVSKEYLARQNAPSNMYAGPIIDTPNQSVTGQPQIRNGKYKVFAGQGSNANFGNAQAYEKSIEAKILTHPNVTLASGEFLHAVLETAIHSDLPGMVRAVVSKPAYSYTGEHTLIPAGSRLIGQYSSSMIQGQNRVMVLWQRIILPEGIVVQLDSPGTDALGRAGQGADSVNTHFFARFGQAALLSLMGAGVATQGVGNQTQYNSSAQYRTAIAQSLQQSANQSLQGTLPIKPTLHINQGAKINVFVAHDLNFHNVLKNQQLLEAKKVIN